jgi:hypothetical protein
MRLPEKRNFAKGTSRCPVIRVRPQLRFDRIRGLSERLGLSSIFSIRHTALLQSARTFAIHLPPYSRKRDLLSICAQFWRIASETRYDVPRRTPGRPGIVSDRRFFLATIAFIADADTRGRAISSFMLARAAL